MPAQTTNRCMISGQIILLNISAAKDLGLDEVKSLLEEILRENKVYIERISHMIRLA